MKRFSGFSLIELMVVVVVIGILSAIAIPQYNDYVTRSRIADATSGLAARRVRMEQFFQDNRTYVGATGCADGGSQVFTFSCTPAATAATYTLQAAGIGPMAGFTFTINETGARASTVDAALIARGWASNAGCWIRTKGGGC